MARETSERQRETQIYRKRHRVPQTHVLAATQTSDTQTRRNIAEIDHVSKGNDLSDTY
jgi:hypothetical protein